MQIDELVSIVLPTRNRAQQLTRSIRSVINQTYDNWELLVIDDGSTDNTKEVVASFDDKRIKYVVNHKSHGAGSARNLGIEHSQANLIAFQDSDDEWLPDKLTVQVETLLMHPSKVAMAYSPMIRVFEDTNQEAFFPAPVFDLETQDLYRKALALGVKGIGIQSCLIRKSALQSVGGFDEQLPRWIDLELFIRLAKEYQFQYVDKPLVKYYFSKVSISTNTNAQIKASKYILRKYKDDIMDIPEILGPHLRVLANGYFKNNELSTGREYLKRLKQMGQATNKDSLKLFVSSFGGKFYSFVTKTYHTLQIKGLVGVSHNKIGNKLKSSSNS